MPYIKQDARERAFRNPQNAGELNYALTRTILNTYTEINYAVLNDIIGALEYFKLHDALPVEYQYQGGDDLLTALFEVLDKYEGPGVLGAIECVKLEFYARVVRPYEDKKINENGDVFGSAEASPTLK